MRPVTHLIVIIMNAAVTVAAANADSAVLVAVVGAPVVAREGVILEML